MATACLPTWRAAVCALKGLQKTYKTEYKRLASAVWKSMEFTWPITLRQVQSLLNGLSKVWTLTSATTSQISECTRVSLTYDLLPKQGLLSYQFKSKIKGLSRCHTDLQAVIHERSEPAKGVNRLYRQLPTIERSLFKICQKAYVLSSRASRDQAKSSKDLHQSSHERAEACTSVKRLTGTLIDYSGH